jgi:hypothetical protein
MSKTLILAGAALLAALAGGGLLLFPGTPPSQGEEGTFENDCCGTVTLAKGRIALNGGQSIRYRVARDARGPYVLPGTYVGALEDQGFEVDGTQPAQKLRLDRLPAPQAIELPLGTRAFVFRRKGLPAVRP